MSLSVTHTRSHNAKKKSHRVTAVQRIKIAWTALPNQSTCWVVLPSLRPSQSKILVGATSCLVSRAISHATAPSEMTVNAKERLSATMFLSGCSIIMMDTPKWNLGSGLEMEMQSSWQSHSMLQILISSFNFNQPMMGFQTFLDNKGAVLKF